MANIILVLAFLIVPVLGEQQNSIYTICPHKDVLLKLAETMLNDSSILYQDVCTLSEDNWKLIDPICVQYSINVKTVSYKTGSFNLTALDETFNKEQLDWFFAAQCEEEYNMEEDMDSKIAIIVKGFLLRGGQCGGLPDKKEACKENQEEGEDNKVTTPSEIVEKNRSQLKKSHSKKSTE